MPRYAGAQSFAEHDPDAAEALDLYCYVAKKHFGALTTMLGGLGTGVITGGIGAHAPRMCAAICHGLEYLGIEIDEAHNRANASVVSRTSRVTVRAIETDEERVIARHIADVIRGLARHVE